MNELDLTPGFSYLMKENHQGMVHGALKKLHISPLNPQYDDLLQEGFICFARKYVEYQQRQLDTKLDSYIYQGVYWHLLDMLRKQQNVVKRTDSDNADLEIMVDDQEISYINDLQLLNQLWLNCTHDQRKFLCSSFNEGMTVTQIARKYRVSRKTVYKWKKGVQKEYLKIR